MDYKINDKLLKNVINNAGYHASNYRGKDITDLFYNGKLSTEIKNGTFDDIFIGDYIIGKSSKRKYLVADIDYYLHTGDTECTTHHIVMVPEQSMGNARMNATDTTNGAYLGSEMYKTNLASYKSIIENDFGSDHMMTHRNIFANAVENRIEVKRDWANSCVELMNEINVYGSNVYHNISGNSSLSSIYEIDNSQFALFRFNKSKLVCFIGNSRGGYWLRDVSSDYTFCRVTISGLSLVDNASFSNGVRPAFTIY